MHTGPCTQQQQPAIMLLACWFCCCCVLLALAAAVAGSDADAHRTGMHVRWSNTSNTMVDAAWPLRRLVAASIADCGLERISWAYIYCYRKLRENVHLDKNRTSNKKQTRRHLGVPVFFYFWFPVNFADKNSHTFVTGLEYA